MTNRRFPVGAEVQKNGVHFRVWAPKARDLRVRLADSVDLANATEHTLAAESDGYFSALVPGARVGQHYRFVVESGAWPDPASRFQPRGPHAASRIVDPATFSWTDAAWRGLAREGQVIYELHIGTFTPEGTWTAAAERLAALADLGITVIEVMPVADFSGERGWGYDGVNLFAPTRLYGEPDDFRCFVDRAHALGLGVILDVVYNHFGPEGNYLAQFSDHYVSTRYKNEWGEALNFDGEHSQPVREFFVTNARYWIEEFHLDGLRFDATQQIFDASPEHVLATIARTARAAAGSRGIYLVGETETQETRLVRPQTAGGCGFDALWNDDFHHSAIVALTGRNEAYYSDYDGKPQEFISSAKWGFLFQGQRYAWQKKRRGSPALDLHPSNFIAFLENHDQTSNSLRGAHLHADAGAARLRAMTALLLLGPATPMLFQGQEFSASAPFVYFADHPDDLAKLVRAGRAQFLSQFPSVATAPDFLPNPQAEESFLRCKLDWSERERHREAYLLHRDLLRLRREDPVIGKVRREALDGAIVGHSAFVLRYFSPSQNDRLLLVNLNHGVRLDPVPEPLLAPPEGCRWELRWSSEDPRYGGTGTPIVESETGEWRLPGQATILMVATPAPTHESSPLR